MLSNNACIRVAIVVALVSSGNAFAQNLKSALVEVSGIATTANGNLTWRVLERNPDLTCTATEILLYDQPYDDVVGPPRPTTPKEICDDAAVALNGGGVTSKCISALGTNFVRLTGKLNFCVSVDGNTLIPGNNTYNDADGISVIGQGKLKMSQDDLGYCTLQNGICLDDSFFEECDFLEGTFNAETCVPTMSEWGVAVMLLLVLTAGTIVVMRRREVAAAA